MMALFLFTCPAIVLGANKPAAAPRELVLAGGEVRAFDIVSRELLAMGENARNVGNFPAAFSYFYELREKVGASMGKGAVTRDYVLASALLLEAGLFFPSGAKMHLRPPNAQLVDISEILRGVIALDVPEGIAADVQDFWEYTLACYFLKQGQLLEARAGLEGVWKHKGETATARSARLGDLHNWVLLKYLDVLAGLANESAAKGGKPEETRGYWEAMIAACGEYMPQTDGQPGDVISGGDKNGYVRSGEILERRRRVDVRQGEFIRKRVGGLMALGRYKEAEDVLARSSRELADRAEERRLLLLTCMASVRYTKDVRDFYEECLKTCPLPNTAQGQRFAMEWSAALWALHAQVVKAANWPVAMEYLEQLEPLMTTQADRLHWVSAYFHVLGQRIFRINSGDRDLLGQLLAKAQKYAVEPLGAVPSKAWKSFLDGLSGSEKASYFDNLYALYYLIAEKEHLCLQSFDACDFLQKLSNLAAITPAQRYQALKRRAAISLEINRPEDSIDTYVACETMKGISAEQKSEALALAADIATEAVLTKPLARVDSTRLTQRAISLYERLLTVYPETNAGHEAALRLGNFLFALKRYAEAMKWYEKGVSLPKQSASLMSFCKLGWCRACRLMMEVDIQQKKTTYAQKQDAEPLKTVRQWLVEIQKAPVAEIIDQAQYEQYRWALLEGNPTQANAVLGKLLQQGRSRATRTRVYWLALYRQLQAQANANATMETMQPTMQEFLTAYGQRKGGASLSDVDVPMLILLGDIYERSREWIRASECYSRVAEDKSSEEEAQRYAKYESVYCTYMRGNYAKAHADWLAYFGPDREGWGDDLRAHEYRCRMLLGDIELGRRNYDRSGVEYDKAAKIFGEGDYRTHFARCRKAEAWLLRAEDAFQRAEGKTYQEAVEDLSRAVVVFNALLEAKLSNREEDHFLELSLRAQFRLGECYEQFAQNGEKAEQERARRLAQEYYERVCDWFVPHYKRTNRLTGSMYYIKSIDRLVKMLIANDGVEPSADTMDVIARRCEEYAALGIEGSSLAKARAESIRALWH